MLIYNTLSGRKEELKNTKNRINLFVCGPTVYDYQHIGNAKNYLAFDIIVSYLRSAGYKIFYLQNITDIDDKIIKRAKEDRVSAIKLANKFIKAYLEDMKALGIASVNKYARATKFIKQIVKQVKSLIDKGYAYKAEDGYYFNIAKFKEYGKLSRRTAEQAEDGISRIDEGAHKINKGDFCLWKFYKKSTDEASGEPYWNTFLGIGRPGWHIEDTAITEKFFGAQYDIHGGGLDLKFPHHEAELAQQEAASGLKPFVRFWMHSGLLYINGEKMSKSLNNFITIRDLLKTCPAEVFRYIVLMHHYRSPINYTDSLLSQARKSLSSIKEFMAKLDFAKAQNSKMKMESRTSIGSLLKEADGRFMNAMEDDFNTPSALASIFDLMSALQDKVWTLSSSEAGAVRISINDKLNAFGLSVRPLKIPNNIVKIGKLRERARAHKQFIQSDALRKEIESLGYKAEDTPIGQFIFRTN